MSRFFEYDEEPTGFPVRQEKRHDPLFDAYRRREVPCVICVGNSLLLAYNKECWDSVGLNQAGGLVTDFTFVYGAYTTPELRITITAVETRGTITPSQKIARITIPITAMAGNPRCGQEDWFGTTAFHLSLPVDLGKVILSETAASEATRISELGIFRQGGRDRINIYMPEAMHCTAREYVQIMSQHYSTPQSCEVVDEGLDCLFKTSKSSLENLYENGKINDDFPRPQHPIPASFVFPDNRSYVLRLQASSREEALCQKEQTNPFRTTDLPCALLPDNSSA